MEVSGFLTGKFMVSEQMSRKLYFQSWRGSLFRWLESMWGNDFSCVSDYFPRVDVFGHHITPKPLNIHVLLKQLLYHSDSQSNFEAQILIQTLSRSQSNKNIETIILWYFKSCVFTVVHVWEQPLPITGHFFLQDLPLLFPRLLRFHHVQWDSWGNSAM